MMSAHDQPDKEQKVYYKHTATVALSIPVLDREFIQKEIASKHLISSYLLEKKLDKLELYIEESRTVAFLHDLIEDAKDSLIPVNKLKNLGFSSELPEHLIHHNEKDEKCVKVGYELLEHIGLNEKMIDALKLLDKTNFCQKEYQKYSEEQKSKGKAPLSFKEFKSENKSDLYKKYIDNLKNSGNELAITAKYFYLLHNQSQSRASGSFFNNKGYEHHLSKLENYSESIKTLMPVVINYFAEKLGIKEKNKTAMQIIKDSWNNRNGSFIATHAISPRRKHLFGDKHIKEKLATSQQEGISGSIFQNNGQSELEIAKSITCAMQNIYSRSSPGR